MRELSFGWVLLMLCTGAHAEPETKVDVRGTWLIMTDRLGDDVEATLVIKGEGHEVSGEYTTSKGVKLHAGFLVFSKGVLSFERDIHSALSESTSIPPTRIEFRATVKGDTLRGTQTFQKRTYQVWGARGGAAIQNLKQARKAARARDADIEDIEVDYDKNAVRAVARDAFPVLFDPTLTPAAQAVGIEDDELVIGIAKGVEAKAYPVLIMGRHELVNDKIDKDPIAASW